MLRVLDSALSQDVLEWNRIKGNSGTTIWCPFEKSIFSFSFLSNVRGVRVTLQSNCRVPVNPPLMFFYENVVFAEMTICFLVNILKYVLLPARFKAPVNQQPITVVFPGMFDLLVTLNIPLATSPFRSSNRVRRKFALCAVFIGDLQAWESVPM